LKGDRYEETAEAFMPPGKKIAVIVPKYGLLGGAERFAYEVTERLANETNHEFHVFANNWKAAKGSPVIFHKIPRLRFPRSLRPWAFAWLIQRAIQSKGFDLVHSHDRIFHSDVVSLHCIPHRFWIRDIRRKRASLFDRSAIAVEKRLIQKGLKTTFLPVSSIAHAAFQSEYGQLPGHWKLMHPGVDFARFSSPDREQCRAEIYARYRLQQCGFLVLFVGMNFALKGLDTVMESVAIARLQKAGSGIGLLVVGRGDEKKYQAKARQLGIGDAVAFTGPVTVDIERYYRAADTLMMLSAFDTFGMVVLEAMAASLPIIIGPLVGARDIVDQGKNGFVLPSEHDKEAAAGFLLTMIGQDNHQRLAANAVSTAAKCDWSELAASVSAVYDSKP
jgi:UDP-glucose:(heptosyl)LPS alpha-1,3-glucosyltransferase